MVFCTISRRRLRFCKYSVFECTPREFKLCHELGHQHNRYWNMLWYCTRVGIPMPFDNGPVPRTANIIIRFDEKPLSERLSQDLGCKDVKEYKKLCEGFELASPTYQTSMRTLLQKRSANSDKVKRSSIYHQFLWPVGGERPTQTTEYAVQNKASIDPRIIY